MAYNDFTEMLFDISRITQIAQKEDYALCDQMRQRLSNAVGA